jgi:hypothetical protein
LRLSALRPRNGVRQRCDACEGRVHFGTPGVSTTLYAVLEPCAAKVACPVLRGLRFREETQLPNWPNDPTQHVSHETIYTAIYAQPRGELRRQLIACLRHGHSTRMSRKRGTDRRGQIPDMVSYMNASRLQRLSYVLTDRMGCSSISGLIAA